MTVLNITVLGDPVGKGRPRFTRAGFAYTPAKTANYENLVLVSFQEKYPDWTPVADVPIAVEWHAYYSIPKSWSNKKKIYAATERMPKLSKPDTDNIAKIKDALNQVAWHDDAQVYYEAIGKYYSLHPRLEIKIDIEDGKDE